MSYRVVDAFVYLEAVYPGGRQVEDDDPILQTHAHHFAKVSDTAAGAAETATAAPGQLRHPTVPATPEPDLGAWLDAENAHHNDVLAWLAAEEEHNTPAPPQQTQAPRRQKRRGATSDDSKGDD